jgi:hypothetical protein
LLANVRFWRSGKQRFDDGDAFSGRDIAGEKRRGEATSKALRAAERRQSRGERGERRRRKRKKKKKKKRNRRCLAQR